MRLLYGLVLEQEPEVFREVKIFFSSSAKKLLVFSSLLPADEAKLRAAP